MLRCDPGNRADHLLVAVVLYDTPSSAPTLLVWQVFVEGIPVTNGDLEYRG